MTRRVVVRGLVAVVVAMTATTVAAAVARTAGADLEVPQGGEPIPLPGIAVVTGVFSSVGVVLAAALGRWSAHPAERFVRTAIFLTATSLVPPLLVDADAATTATLVVLHVLAASVMVPALAGSLREPGRVPKPGRQAGTPAARLPG